MKWLNIEIETLRGSEFLGAEPVERATWLSLLGWCAAQENDGIIRDCAEWGSRKWQQLCGVTLEEVTMLADLYGFQDVDLHVHFYPLAQQAAVKSKRENGKKGGRPKKVKAPEPLKTKEEKPHGSDSLNLDHNLDGNVIVKVIEKKGNSKVKNTLVSDETKALLLDLWNNSPKQARNRSSKKKVADAWNRVKSKPDKNQILDAMDAWCRCDDWRKDQGQFIQGLHIWIKDEKWEDLPDTQPTQEITQKTFGELEADRKKEEYQRNMRSLC